MYIDNVWIIYLWVLGAAVDENILKTWEFLFQEREWKIFFFFFEEQNSDSHLPGMVL